MKPDLTVVSLGAGVQSSVMLLMLDGGELGPRPDAAIFADTGWEPRAVYDNLEWLKSQVSIPIHVATSISGASLRRSTWEGRNVRDTSTSMPIPVFIRNPDGTNGWLGRRHCTEDWKILPVRRMVRELLGIPATGPVRRMVHMQMGISTDEIHRVKPSRQTWIENTYPLIDGDMSRWKCREWMANRYPGRTLPRSACVSCPFRSDQEWMSLKATDPAGFADAVATDRHLREGGKVPKVIKGELYLHRKLMPLEDAVAEAEAGRDLQPSLFGEECMGVCGV